MPALEATSPPVGIARIEAFAVRYPEPNNDGKIRSLTLVRVEADDRQVGWGEAISGAQETSLAVKLIAERRLAPLLVGQDPTDVIAQLLPDREWIVEVGLLVQVPGLDHDRLPCEGMGRRRGGGPAAPLGREVCWVEGQPAPGRPAFMTGSSRAPCAFDPNEVGLVRPTRS
jgi:hypothetical protein